MSTDLFLFLFFNLVLLLLLLALLLLWRRFVQALHTPEPAPSPTKRSYTLHPHSPRDCHLCQVASPTHPTPDVLPWSARKSSRGRPKSATTDGFYCDNPACHYFQVRDETLHALVRDGVRGKHEPIPWLRCQACGHRFSQRRHTAMRALKTPSHRVDEVITALGEGVDQAAATRIFRHHPTTIARWLTRFATLDAPLHDRFFARIIARYIQLDELKAKTRRVAEVWVWIALDVSTKLILSFQVGDRSQTRAYALIHEVANRLPPGCIPIFSSDGLRMYFYALTAHFGHWMPPAEGQRVPRWHVDPRLLFAQLIKVKSGYRLKFLKTVLRCGSRDAYRAALQALGFSGLVETAFVERLNLTLRELVAPLSRRTWSIADSPLTLTRHLQLGRVYYHFCRTHQSLSIPLKHGRYRKRTPAMAAGVLHRPLRARELLLTPI